MQRHVVLMGPDYALVNGARVPLGTGWGLPLLPSGQRGWGMRAEGVELGSALAMSVVAEPGLLKVAGRADGLVMIVFVLSGELVAHTPDGRLELGAGRAWFARSSLDYAVEWPVRTVTVSLTVPCAALEEFGSLPSEQIGALDPPSLLHDSALRFIEAVAGSSISNAGLAPSVVERWLLEMAGALLVSDAGPRAVERAGLEDIRHRAQRMIRAKYADSLYGTAELAADLNVSLRQLQRSFAVTGDTPAAALARMRLEQAQRLLQDPAYRVLDMAEIARFAGYRSARQLREHFRRAGLGAPRDARSQHPVSGEGPRDEGPRKERLRGD